MVYPSLNFSPTHHNSLMYHHCSLSLKYSLLYKEKSSKVVLIMGMFTNIVYIFPVLKLIIYGYLGYLHRIIIIYMAADIR